MSEQLALPITLHPQLLSEIMEEVMAERARQDAKWGEQNHPFITWLAEWGHATLKNNYKWLENYFKSINEKAVQEGTLGWDTILIEELYEALAKAGVDDVEYEKELIETAAVCIAMVEANRRKRNV